MTNHHQRDSDDDQQPARPNITGSASWNVRVTCSGRVRAGGRKGQGAAGAMVMCGQGALLRRET